MVATNSPPAIQVIAPGTGSPISGASSAQERSDRENRSRARGAQAALREHVKAQAQPIARHAAAEDRESVA
jgi:hypothetical protein